MTTETYEIVAGNPTIKKDPNATLDYSIDWSNWLALVGDTIASVAWSVTGGLTAASNSFTATAASVVLSGGTAGTAATATCRITTAGGRIDDRTLYFTVQER